MQMGNLTVDQLFWGRPEDITTPRPYYAVPLNRAAFTSSAVDLGGSIAAGLLAAYAAVPNAPNATLYLATGVLQRNKELTGRWWQAAVCSTARMVARAFATSRRSTYTMPSFTSPKIY